MIETEEKGLITQEESAFGHIVITEAQMQLIKNTVAVGATDDELKLFFFECRRRGVHPLDRLIHFVKRKAKVGDGYEERATFQASIDFVRSQAEGTREYRGQEDIEFGKMITQPYGDSAVEVPEWAKATVKRRDRETGELINTTATVYWVEFYPGDKLGFMWRKMPRVMLGKCAESQALRKSFPRQLAGLYSFEEMEQADVIQAPERPPIIKPQPKQESATPPPAENKDCVITEKQRGRFYAIAKSTGAADDRVKKWLLKHYGLNSSKMITTDIYEDVCEKILTLSEPGSQG